MPKGLFPHEDRASFGVMMMRVFIGHSGLLLLLWLFMAVCGLFGSSSDSKLSELAVVGFVVLLFPFFTMIPVFGDRMPDGAVPWLMFVVGLWVFTVIFWTFVVTAAVSLSRRLRDKHIVRKTGANDAASQISSGDRDTSRPLLPYSHPWTSSQKWIIAGTVSFGVILLAAFIVGYELHLRHSLEADLIEHRWSMQGCIDCSTDIIFHADHTIDVTQAGTGLTFRGKGTWQLNGRDVVVVDYRVRADTSTPLPEEHTHQSLWFHGSMATTISAQPMLYVRED